MQYIFMTLFAALAVVADQLSKHWVVTHINSARCYSSDCQAHLATLQNAYHVTAEQMAALPRTVKGIPKIFHFSHVHNTGAAFSSFQGQRWLFAAIFLVFTAAVIWEFSKKKLPFSRFDRWCIAAIFAGGLGNMIDRIRLGFVVDMIDLEFMNFPVFNVADCFITCGCIALMVSLIFFNKAFWKDDKKK